MTSDVRVRPWTLTQNAATRHDAARLGAAWVLEGLALEAERRGMDATSTRDALERMERGDWDDQLHRVCSGDPDAPEWARMARDELVPDPVEARDELVVERLAETLGVPLMPWQKRVLADLLAARKARQWRPKYVGSHVLPRVDLPSDFVPPSASTLPPNDRPAL